MVLPDIVLEQLLLELNEQEQLKLRFLNHDFKSRVDSLYIDYNLQLKKKETSLELVTLKNVGTLFSRVTLDYFNFDDMESIIDACPRVRKLDLNLSFAVQKVDALLKRVKTLLKCYNIVSFRVKQNAFFSLSALFNTELTIRELDLNFPYSESNREAETLSNAVLPKLKKLTFSGHISNVLFTVIKERFSNLTHLSINRFSVCDQAEPQAKRDEISGYPYVFPILPFLVFLNICCRDIELNLGFPTSTTFPKLKYLKLQVRKLELYNNNGSIWPKVENLNICARAIDWQGVFYHFPNLKLLKFDRISPATFGTSVKELEEPKSLKYLILPNPLADILIKSQTSISNLKRLSVQLEYKSVFTLLFYCMQNLINLTTLQVNTHTKDYPVFDSGNQKQTLVLPKLKVLKISILSEELIFFLKFVSTSLPNLMILNLVQLLDEETIVPANFIEFTCNLAELLIIHHGLKFSQKEYLNLFKMTPKLIEIFPVHPELVSKQPGLITRGYFKKN